MSHRLKKSVEEMATFCRDLLYAPDPSGRGGSWIGVIQPIRELDRLHDLLDDIHHNRAFYTAPGGSVRHLPGCQARHCHHDWMDQVNGEELRRAFRVRIFYTGGREDPRCWVAGIDRTNGKHMWGDDSICPFLSSRNTWGWTRDTVADFVGHVSAWLISWMVFQGSNVWVVGEHGNTAAYHLARIAANDHCWCRSGKKYWKCCRQKDELEVIRGGG